MTTPLAAVVPPAQRPAALTIIRVIHTALFFSIAAAIFVTIWDGVRTRPTRRTALAAGVVLAESTIYASNNQVCPLTPLAEELGAERGSVVDMFLPDWVARRIPLMAGSAALLTAALNVTALLRGRGDTGKTSGKGLP